MNMSSLTMLVDSREQTPLPFPDGVRSRRVTLRTGDYTACGLEAFFVAERKSLADLVSSVTRGRDRLEAEFDRMAPFPLRALFVVGEARMGVSCLGQLWGHQYRSLAEPSAVMASVAATATSWNCRPSGFAFTMS